MEKLQRNRHGYEHALWAMTSAQALGYFQGMFSTRMPRPRRYRVEFPMYEERAFSRLSNAPVRVP
jgi:hypothetical protein